MIKLRFSSFEANSKDKQFEIIEGEKIADMIDRCLVGIPLGDFKPEQIFISVVNGHIIPHESWAIHTLHLGDTVLIAPLLGDGDTGSILKTALIIAITAVASVYLSPAVGGGIYGALAVAAVSIGSTLLLNALIPPPVVGADALNSGNSYADSQMYAISNQSNTVSKFGTVPKVYGTFRMFPNIAATPYTELEADPDSDGFIEYLYAIYDFGLGTCSVGNIQIGDTPIESFTDVFYQLVDPNLPDVSTGPWDDVMVKDFTFFKGSADSDTFSISLDANESDSGEPLLYTYQVVRNSAEDTTGVEETITLSFANEQGLYGYDQATRVDRTIQLKIEFAPVGSDQWVGFNDFNYVKSFTAVGGDTQYAITEVNYFAPGSLGQGYQKLYADTVSYITYGGDTYGQYSGYLYFGYPRGTQQIILPNSNTLKGLRVGAIVVSTIGVGLNINFNEGASGSTIKSSATYVGRVANIIYSVDKSPPTIVFEEPIPRALTLYFMQVVYPDQASFYTSYVTTPISKILTPITRLDFTGANYLYFGIPNSGSAVITAQTTESFYSTFGFTPITPGQYQLRVTRLSTSTDGATQYQDALTWQNITTRFAVSPIATKKRHTFLELRIKATSQLSGSVSNLSAVCSSVLDVYDTATQTWSKQITNNPAWVFADMMTGEVNKRPVDKSRLDLTSLLQWRDYCDAIPTSPQSRTYSYPRFQTNFVLDYVTTLQDVIGQVTNAAQASLAIIDGNYGVLIDQLRTVPVQIFTPRNSSDFASSRVYTTRPDGLQITFVDPLGDWDTSTITVYDEGFNETTASVFDSLTSFACTNVEQAWRFGRYMLFQNRLRQETITLTVDFEYLVCTRGDYVQIAQDVMKVGGTPARVTSVNSARITIDDGIIVDNAINYGYVYRSGVDGNIYQGILTIVLSDTFDLVGPIPVKGDLIIIGEVGQVVYDCIVKAINPTDDLKASLTLVEKADAIYTAESTDTFAEYDPQLNRNNPTGSAPAEVEDFQILSNSYRCNGTSYQYYIDLDWDIPLGSAPQYYEIYADTGKGYNYVDQTRLTDYEYIADPNNLNVPYNFKILAVSASGLKLNLGEVTAQTATPLYKTARPADVAGLTIGITNEVIQLAWPKVDACDIQNYLIRYSPDSQGTWENSVQLLTAAKDQTMASTQGRVGIYLIKAVDFNGNQSTNAAEAITTIPNLFNLNIIEQRDDFPTLGGVYDQVQKVGNVLILQNVTTGGVATNSYYSSGYYYFKDLLDLKDIFSVRLQSLIQASGITAGDIMQNWGTVQDVPQLSSAGSQVWDVQAEYRSTNQINVMSEWAQLSLINPLSQGVQEDYTPWRIITSTGDATGRIFQFRLHLISNDSSVTPRVSDAIIKADMPDRLDSYTGLTSPATGPYVLTYTTGFRGPGTSPNVQVTIDNAQSGDYYSFDYKTLTGLSIRFFNASGTQVSRLFDVQCKGYGSSYSTAI